MGAFFDCWVRTSSLLPEARTQLQSLDKAGVDQQPVEAARLGTTVAAVEQAVAALEHLLLLDEARRRYRCAQTSRPNAMRSGANSWEREPSFGVSRYWSPVDQGRSARSTANA